MRRRSRISLVVAIAGLAISGLPAAPASAATWTATVIKVLDGDTIDARVGGSTVRVRLTAVQAMEIGWCNAAAATARLRGLIEGKTVTLKARYASSTNRGRYLRWVYRSGVDVGEILLKEGLAFAAPHSVEYYNNTRYLAASQRAQALKIGPLWDDDRCGDGPAQASKLKMWVEWDADSDDSRNINGEYIRIWNQSSTTVSLKGWRVRDSGLTIYRFPDSAQIAPWRSVTVRVGKGTNTSTTFYWGQSVSVFNNGGDAAVLTDPNNDIRGAMQYPCKAYCWDYLKGKIKLWASRKGSTPNSQYVKIENISDRRVNLNGYVLRNYPYGYDFANKITLSSYLYPGEIMRVLIGKGTDSRLKRYWGKSVRILDSRSDIVTLRTFDDIRVACFAWGSRRC